MQRISFAPVLSATRSRDSCWITSLLPYLSHRVRPQLLRRATRGSCPGPGRQARSLAPIGRPWRWSARPGPTVHGTRSLLGLLHDLDQPPPLGGRQGPGLHDLHAVAHARDVLLVV